MKYFLCTLIGLSLIVASCVALAYAVYQLRTYVPPLDGSSATPGG